MSENAPGSVNSQPVTGVSEIGHFDFMGTRLDRITVDEFIEWSQQQLTAGSATFVTYLNAYCSNIAAKNAAYRELLKRANCVYADGMGVVWGARFLNQSVPQRVNAADFILQFLAMCAANNFSVGLIGSADGVAIRAAERFKSEVPGLKISVVLSGYIKSNTDTIAAIRQAKPNILMVGMGVPLQETWVAENRALLAVPYIWCVGAMFEFYAGYTRRAPAWMCRVGLEWLFRLIMEPRRMAKRYLIGNAVFLSRVLRAKF